MNDLNEHNLMEALSPLSGISPPVEGTQHILQSAQRTVRRRTITYWTRMSAVAALIVIAVFIGITNFPQQGASAAEALAQATQATDGYKGWVQLNTKLPDGGDDEDITFNTETGIFLYKKHVTSHFEVRMYVPNEKKQIIYDSKDGQIKITQMDDLSAEIQKKNTHVLGQMTGYSTTASSTSVSSIPGMNVIKSTDNNLLRLEITFPPDDSKKAFAENRTIYPRQMIVWADPSTKLIQRRQVSTAAGQTFDSTYHYGGPAVDIYDVGVPRDAKVLDLRPTMEATDLLGKLQKRLEAGFGNYTAVRAEEYAQWQNGKSTFHQTNAYVYANDVDPFLAEQFRMNVPIEVDDQGNPVRRTSPPPAGWPTPTFEAALASLTGQEPSMFLIRRGNDFLAGDAGYDANIYAKLPGRSFKDRGLPNLKANYTLPGLFWTVSIILGNTDIKPQLITQNDHAGLLGLKYEFTQDCNGPQGPGTEKLLHVYWFDPTKDLAPVSFDLQTTAPENWKEMDGQVHTNYSMFVRTDNGKWYPSAWTTMENHPTQNLKIVSDNHLQIWTNKKLGSEWFTDPATRPAINP